MHVTIQCCLLFIWLHTPNSVNAAGVPQVIGSSQHVLAKVGDDVTLPCRISPPVNMVKMTVEWSRPDLDPEYVHIHQNGHNQNGHGVLNPSYEQRTSLFGEEELRGGNISLKLSSVQLSDDGTFRCFVPSLRKSSSIQLRVVGHGGTTGITWSIPITVVVILAAAIAY